VLSIVVIIASLTAPRLSAVQLWTHKGPVRAWAPNGQLLPKTISLDHGDSAFQFPAGSVVELIAELPVGANEDWPDAQWIEPKGLKPYSKSSGWKNDRRSDGVACFGLACVAKGSTGSIKLLLSQGNYRIVGTAKKVRQGTWTLLGNGISARITRHIYHDEGDTKLVNSKVELQVPMALKAKDLQVTMWQSDGQEQSEVSSRKSPRGMIFGFEGAPSAVSVLKLGVRDYAVYRFDGIHLTPNP
jgi:hypothetical protein